MSNHRVGPITARITVHGKPYAPLNLKITSGPSVYPYSTNRQVQVWTGRRPSEVDEVLPLFELRNFGTYGEVAQYGEESFNVKWRVFEIGGGPNFLMTVEEFCAMADVELEP